MNRFPFLLAALFFTASYLPAWPQEKSTKLPGRLSDGVYSVQRESLKEIDVVPLKDGEVLVVHQHRFLQKDAKKPPRFLVVHAAPDVNLELAAAPQADKEGKDVVRILLKLQPQAARELERLSSDRRGRQITIILGGEVVTMHKIRDVIKSGELQITNCAPGAANYLLEQLQAHQKNK